jgi:hypothetical protein
MWLDKQSEIKMENNVKIGFFDAEEFIKSCKKTGLANEVSSEIIKERQKVLIDEDQILRDKAWNELANKIVGS